MTPRRAGDGTNAGGGGRAGKFGVAMGEAVFAQSVSVDIQAGPNGMAVLVARTGVGGPAAQGREGPGDGDAGGPGVRHTATFHTRAKAPPAHGAVEKMQ